MRIGSLFAGIGGFDLAARWMGWETAWFSEIDQYASAVLAQHWPGVPNHGDITKIDFRAVEPVDLLCGGFPCQDISNAGKRAGIEGARSGLWGEYARAIGELRPRYVVVENVAALLGRGLGRVLGDLAALGYDAEWQVLSAADVGAPHLRERLWIVAYAHGGRGAHGPPVARPGRTLPPQGPLRVVHRGDVGANVANPHPIHRIGWAGQQRTGWRGESTDGGDPMAHATSQRCQPAAGPRNGEPCTPIGEGAVSGCGACLNWWATEPDVGRVAHGIPAQLDSRRETFPTPDCQNHRDGKVRRKAAKGRHGVSLHHYIEGVDEASNCEETSAAGGAGNGGMPGLWGDAPTPAAPSRPLQAGGCGDSLPGMPHKEGDGGWHMGLRPEEAEILRHLWRGVHPPTQQEALDLLQRVPIGGGPAQCPQALGWWEREPNVPRVAHGVANRVDRLKGLGNAIVPLCAYLGPFQVVAEIEARMTEAA